MKKKGWKISVLSGALVLCNNEFEEEWLLRLGDPRDILENNIGTFSKIKSILSEAGLKIVDKDTGEEI